MGSKLEYLSKYTDDPDADESDKKKKKKKAKKSKKSMEKTSRNRAKPTAEALNVNDEDEVTLRQILRDDGPPSDDDDIEHADGEDRPIVVAAEELPDQPVSLQPQGVWETVDLRNESSKSLLPPQQQPSDSESEKGDSPPRRSRRRRHDSDDDDESHDDIYNRKSGTSTKRRSSHSDSSKGETEHRRRRRRYDSSDDEDSVQGRNLKSYQENDREPQGSDKEKRSTVRTSDEVSVGSNGKPVKSNRRRRHDSDDDASSNGLPQKRRHDSDNEESSGGSRRGRRRRRHDSDEEEHVTKRSPRQDSDGQSSVRKRRYDSDDDDDEIEPRSSRKHLIDSEDEQPPLPPELPVSSIDRRHNDDARNEHRRPLRKRYDSSDDDSSLGDDDKGHARLSSGHKAGLQNYQDFTRSETKIQAQKNADAHLMVDKYGMGETVYRDKDGKRTNEPESSNKRKQLSPEAQKQLNQGKIQRQATAAREREFQILQESSFARHRDDERLEAMLKSEIREGDPMAAYAAKRQQKKHKKKRSKGHFVDVELEPEKPVYKGPAPKPNRYGIRPGYRWDGVDRGNGFEDKLLAKQFSANLRKEEAYRWRSADM